MSNPRVGVIACPICGGQGEVRRYNGSECGKLYWSCACGQIRPALAAGQAYVETHATFDGGAHKPAPAVALPAALPRPAPADAPEPKPKPRGLAAWIP